MLNINLIRLTLEKKMKESGKEFFVKFDFSFLLKK